MSAAADAVIARHRASGTFHDAGGIRSFHLDEGDGDVVFCLHGVPASSLLYRKLVPALARRGLRGIAPDLPGLGLAERPDDADYSWSGLGRFVVDTWDALDLDRVHLVVHDIGGPVGYEAMHLAPERVASLTVLNTMVRAASFQLPITMRPFRTRLGPLYLKAMTAPAFIELMYLQGIADRGAVPRAEVEAHFRLLLDGGPDADGVSHGDGGEAFLRIMRGFDLTEAAQARYVGALEAFEGPRQIVWGVRDPALDVALHGRDLQRVLGVPEIVRLPGKHFLQEDQFEPLAAQIAELVQA